MDTVIVLAAGKGKRMKSSLPKVLHPFLGKPMLGRVIESVRKTEADKLIVVIPPFEVVERFVKDNYEDVETVIQDEPLGTGDAVKRALPLIEEEGYSLIVPGDVPLMDTSTLKELSGFKGKADLVVVTTVLEDPFGYGRIVRDKEGNIERIVEEKDADEDVRKIREVNTGVYLVRNELLHRYLDLLGKENAQGEYYLTDIVALAVKDGGVVKPFLVEDHVQFSGVNTRSQLVELEKIYLRRIVDKWLENGVTIHFPETVYIEPEVEIGKDTEIFSGVYLIGRTKIGENCRIQAGVRIENSTIGNGVVIKDNSYIEESIVGDECKIGPMAHLRPGTRLAEKVSIGNFVETKKAEIGRGTKINHLSYIGDAEVGEDVNIGAGTITCNYDGFFKYKTIIGDRVFIGSDTQLVAPVKLEDDVYIGAGSTITKDVPKGNLSLTRAEQKFVPGYTYRKREKMKKLKEEKKNQ